MPKLKSHKLNVLLVSGKNNLIEKVSGFSTDVSKLLTELELVKHRVTDAPRAVEGNVLIQRLFHLIEDGNVSEELSSMPYTQEICDKVKEFTDYNYVTYRYVMPNTCYNWHKDMYGDFYHIPLITSPGCMFVYEDQCFHLPADGSLYHVNPLVYHTFVNASLVPRLHLHFSVH